MGKGKRKVASQRSYATTSIASLNETLAIKSLREEAVKVQLEESPSTLEDEKTHEQQHSSELDHGNATPVDEIDEAEWDAAANMIIKEIKSQSLHEGQNPNDAKVSNTSGNEKEVFENDDDAEWLRSCVQSVAISRRKLQKRQLKGRAPGPSDPVLELSEISEKKVISLLQQIGLADDCEFFKSDGSVISSEAWSQPIINKVKEYWISIRKRSRLKSVLLTTLLELEELGFSLEHAAVAIERCGFETSKCIDWLLIHLPNKFLPRSWRADEKPTSVISVTSSSNQTQSVNEGNIKHEPSPDINSQSSTIKNEPIQNHPKGSLSKPSVSEKEKNRILQLAELQRMNEERLEEQERESPNSKLSKMQTNLRALKDTGSTLIDKSEKKALGVQIASLKDEINKLIQNEPSLEFHPDVCESEFQEAESESPMEGDSAIGLETLQSDSSELPLLSIFDAPVSEEGSKRISSGSIQNAGDDIQLTNVDLSESSSSSAKAQPSQLLDQHIRTTWGKKKITYSFKDLKPGHNCIWASVSFKHFVIEMPSTEFCENKKNAQEYVALIALYQIASDYQYHINMGLKAASIWNKWKALAAKNTELKLEEECFRRAQIVVTLVKRYKNVTIEESLQNNWSLLRNVSKDDKLFTSDDWVDFESDENVNGMSVSGTTLTDGKFDAPPPTRRITMDDIRASRVSEELKMKMTLVMDSPKYRALELERQDLPVWSIKDDTVAALKLHDVVVISGSTGSGKTTQIPHMLLVAETLSGKGSSTNIIVTEPRRISAISVAERVSVEFGEEKVGSEDSLVGYQIRGQRCISMSSQIVYCTTGIVLRLLRSDPLLMNYSHIVIDEVHERTVDGDLLLVVLKRVLVERRLIGDPLKVILMSATIDLDKLSAYFDFAPVFQAGGRTYPVSIFPLEDVIQLCGYLCEVESEQNASKEKKEENKYNLDESIYNQMTRITMNNIDENKINFDLIENLLILLTYNERERKNKFSRIGPVERRYLDAMENLDKSLASRHDKFASSCAILVFLPGLTQIQQLYDRLTGHSRFGSQRVKILRLHSSLSSQKEQEEVFHIPPKGVRKIILSTNVAETGVTIPDVVFVIDSGKVKEMTFRTRTQIQALEEVMVSRSSLSQRAGRAGRVRPGVCFQLLSSFQQERLREFPKPEMLRVSLEGVILQVMTIAWASSDPWKFLGTCLDPPGVKAIDIAVDNLYNLGALLRFQVDDLDGNIPPLALTPLGHNLARLPVNATIGKLLLIAALFRCFDPILTVAAAIGSDEQKIFLNEEESKSSDLHKSFIHPFSDLLTYYQTYRAWALERYRSIQNGSINDEGQYFCRKYQLSQKTLLQIRSTKQDLLRHLIDCGFCPPGTQIDTFHDSKSFDYPRYDQINKNSRNDAVLAAVLCAGLFPNIARPVINRSSIASSSLTKASARRNAINYYCKNDERVYLIGRSTNSAMISAGEMISNRNLTGRTGILCFLTKIHTRRTMLYDSTFVPPAALVLLTNAQLEVSPQNKALLADWISMHATPREAVLFKKLREAIEDFLESQFETPDNLDSNRSQELIEAIVNLLKF